MVINSRLHVHIIQYKLYVYVSENNYTFLHAICSITIAFLENVTDHRNLLKFPSDEDLNGAAVALMRLQDTYKLETASIARGELNGVQYRYK